MMLTRKKIMDNISNEEFVRYFNEDFINPESESQEELECEKAHILLRCSGDNANFLGLEKYEQILGDEKLLNILEEKMDFSISEYYNNYRFRNFDFFDELGSAKENIRKLEAEIEEKQRYLESKIMETEIKQREIEHLQFLVDEVMSSTSWKVTGPLRKAVRMLKRRK